MQVIHDCKGGIEIQLSGTQITGEGNPHYGEGTIRLTTYGAKRFAYELLLKVADAEWYALHLAPKCDAQLMAEGKIPIPTKNPV